MPQYAYDAYTVTVSYYQVTVFQL